jgi:hypothetical protein
VNRVVWFTAGAVTGVYALIKARNTARNFTPDGVAARAAAMAAGLRVFRTEVATGMAEKEAELRAQLNPAAEHPPALTRRTPDRQPALAREGRVDTRGHED